MRVSLRKAEVVGLQQRPTYLRICTGTMQAEKSELRHSVQDCFWHVLTLQQYGLLFVEVAGQSVAVKVSRVKWKSTYNIVSDTSVLMIASNTPRLIHIHSLTPSVLGKIDTNSRY